MVKSKRGQIGFNQIAGALLGIFFLVVIIMFLTSASSNGWSNWGDSLADAFTKTGEFFMNILGPLFNAMLNLDDAAGDNAFLMFLTFILIFIVITGTLDSTNIFGDDNKGNLINFAIGAIVSIIGVRYMPQNLWGALTAPSSAFVATILVGAPFAALFFVTMKLKSRLAARLLWLFYIIFMSYLIIVPSDYQGSNSFIGVYIAFLIAAGLMIFFYDKVSRFINKTKEMDQLESLLSDLNAKQRYKLRQDIKEWEAILDDGDASEEDKAEAKKKLGKLKKKYGQDLNAI